MYSHNKHFSLKTAREKVCDAYNLNVISFAIFYCFGKISQHYMWMKKGVLKKYASREFLSFKNSIYKEKYETFTNFKSK